MIAKEKIDNLILGNAPAIEGLSFRAFRGESDYAVITAIRNACKKEDKIDWTQTVEDIKNSYSHLVNCDPYQDMVFAEINGQSIGYARVWWHQLLDGTRTYSLRIILVPAWRGKGIRQALLEHCEKRLRAIAAQHPDDGEKVIRAWASEATKTWNTLLENNAYTIIRYFFAMVRPDLKNIPDLPLPAGVETRQPQPENYRQIWDASEEGFRDHWGEMVWHEEWYTEWLNSRIFEPQLWQVAWDGDEVVGMVQNFIDREENQEYQRQRGYTEDISVRRPWRRQGVARALIARSLKLLKSQGMTEASLGVDAENPNGALQLYTSLGYQVTKKSMAYQKPLR